jgi:hypothetical protein
MTRPRTRTAAGAGRWTIAQLRKELDRRKEKGAVYARAGAAERGVTARFRNIRDLSSGELAALLRERQRAVYGVDDRKDMYEVKGARTRALADASVALVEAGDFRRVTGGWKLTTTKYQDDYDLCSSEPFAEQPLGCFCSGVLVAPDVIATAGHCVKSAAGLAKVRFVFGFRMKNAATARTTFGVNDVYEGESIIGRKLTDDGPDWALIRLTRAVVGRKPVRLRNDGKIPAREPLFVIGHPCGLPQKYAPGAVVRKNTPASHFVANLDTYGGNSGSPVFSARTRVLEGLLVRGETDFVSTGECYVSMVFPSTGGGGEDVNRTTVFAETLANADERARSGGSARRRRKVARGKAR